MVTSTLSSLPDSRLKRRSKSLDDLPFKKVDITSWSGTNDYLYHYNDVSTPTSPIVSFESHWLTTTPQIPQRRHSTCIEPGTKECLRLATIYGWVTANAGCQHESIKNASRVQIEPLNTPNSNTKPKQLLRRQSARSLAASVATGGVSNKLSRMFVRRRKSLTITSHSNSFPTLVHRKSFVEGDLHPDAVDPWSFEKNTTQSKGIVSAIIEAANRPENDKHVLGWVGVEDNTKEQSEQYLNPCLSNGPSPPPPIENDPHVFDLLEKDSPRFIHYSKRDSSAGCTMSSATVEKLVEKLTREMDSEFLLDFFLTFRLFLTPIKLCKLLILRFRWALMEDNDARRLVRIRTFVVIRHWLTHYWSHDFMTSRTLRFMLCTFLSQLRTHPLILASPRDERIIKNLRNILKRQRKFHSSENDDVNTNTDTSQNSAPRNSIQSVHWKNASAKTSIVQLTSEGYRALPKQSSRNCRKDSAIGLIHAAPFKELKPSASTPALPFLTKSRRLSTSSQRSVTEGNAWTAKMNFSIKTIKRSVPSMYHSILHGITPANELSSPERCLCEHNRPRKTSGSLVRSASRIFDSKKKDYKEIMNIPRTSVSTPTTSSSREDPDHPNPLCPLHTIQTPTPTPTPSPLAVPLRSLRRTESFSSQSEIDYSTLTSSSYRPLVLHYRSEVIAQQFCLIEQSMLQSVTWDELAELRWRKHRSKMTNGLVDVGSINSQEGEDDGQTQRLGVEQLIGFFNTTCQWVASEIVRTRSVEVRPSLNAPTKKCYHHRNYSTLMQILLGLQSPAVSRLEKTWQRIDHYEMQIFGELKDMAKPFRNWKNIRDAMTKATEDVAESSAVECVLTQSRADPVVRQTKGCIPFLGLYLSDLVFNAELPTYINAKEDIAASDASPKDEDLSVRLSMHMVNYNKFRIIASVIRHVLAFQVLSRIYTFIIHPELLSALQNMLFLDNAEIRKASFLCEE
ncbi:hypothetical protein DFQ30_007997 [Apophysomyces sp. BC1015]|nr:hypothetical protein DFQ30_007997 [Apophysomyces sp. BC1015]